jgi:uncharacterized protein RhaS with RHS repeats
VGDPLAEKYYGWSPYTYVLNNPTILADKDGQDIDPSKLSASQYRALVKFASTKEGSAFIAQFAQKGFKLGGKTYTQGKYSQHDLYFRTQSRSVMGENRKGLAMTFLKNGKGDAIGKYKKLEKLHSENLVSKLEYAFTIDLKESIDNPEYTIAHEAFVHVQEDIDVLTEIETGKNNKYQNNHIQYLTDIIKRGTSGGIDHRKLKEGKIKELKNWVKEMNAKYNTSKYTGLYREDQKIARTGGF